MRRRRRKGTPLAGVVVVVLVLVVTALAFSGRFDPMGIDTALDPAAPARESAQTPVSDPTPAPLTATDARERLADLATRPWARGQQYDREADFGEAWDDVDRNGCDTRDDILARDLADVRRRSDCKVVSGTLLSPYSGRSVAFTRGPVTSEDVQIDHLVALSDAWRTGAQNLTAAQRLALANDPLELLAVDGPSNDAKGNRNAAEWLPPDTGYRCVYVTRQIQVKAKYRLWVTDAERAAMTRVLASCP
jgi:hypothetical protein